jgi:predicted flap endonuclease-1-like 5' DNA nuclease
LKIVEGIGPKIEELLNQAGITTWQQLSVAAYQQLKDVLEAGGSRFKMHDPTSWAEQARLAMNEDCPSLSKLKKELIGGREGVVVERVSYKEVAKGLKKTNEKLTENAEEIRRRRAKEAEDMSLRLYGKKIKLDDHTVVEGIGPVIDKLLRDKGIQTWLELSETKTTVLQTILDEVGPRFRIHNPGTWARQAQLAHENKWAELRKYQDELDGGRVK